MTAKFLTLLVLTPTILVAHSQQNLNRTITIRADGIKQIYFRDPDGYWIEINDDNPHD